MKIYLMGSMENPNVPEIAITLRANGYDVFDDWFAVGPEADRCWMAYEKARGRSYAEALEGHAAVNVFEFDKRHLDECDRAVLVMPCGRSAHMELGRHVGMGKRGYILLPEEPQKWDIMYRFVYETGGRVCTSIEALVAELAK